MSLRRVHLVLAAAVVPSLVSAQGLEIYKLPVPQAPVGAETGRAQPGVTAASPIAFGPRWGDFFAGGGYQASTRYGGGQDGSVAIGAGLGDPVRRVGMEVVIASASTVRSGFGNRMYGSTKLHKVLPNGAGLGLGVEGISLTGTAQADPSVYLAYTQVQQLNDGDYFNAITWNGGIGNGRFQSEDRVLAGEQGLGVFFSAAVRATPTIAAIADWSGQDLNIGLSFAPFKSLPITISPALVDVLGRAGDGMRFTIGGGISWSGVFRRGTSAPTTGAPSVFVAVPSAGAADVSAAVAPVAAAPVFTPAPEPKPEPKREPEPVVAAAPAAPVTPPAPVRRVAAPATADVDGDGVPNDLDACDASPAVGAIGANGCLTEIVADEAINLANFSFAKTEIRADARGRLDELVGVMKADASVRVEIGGHADEIGTDEVNVVISRQRAEAVKQYFLRRGVPSAQLIVKAYGRSRPIASNDTPANRAKNRRVELTRLP